MVVINFVVPVINQPQLAIEFTKNLSSTQPYGKWHIVFVDNASESPTRRVLLAISQNYQPHVTVITNDTNVGFGPANNLGAAGLEGTIVFTQTDVEFEGDVIKSLSDLQDNILYGSRLLKHDTGWNKFGMQIVPYLEGWFVALTAKTWNKIPHFDPRYAPADFEDIDLCYAAAQQGHALAELPFPVKHNRPGSAGWSQFQNREQVTIAHRELFRQKWNL